MLDGNTAALNKHLNEQDRLEREYQVEREEIEDEIKEHLDEIIDIIGKNERFREDLTEYVREML